MSLVLPNFRAAHPLTAWLPSSLTGLRAWYRKGGTRYQDDARSTLVTASGQPVASWTDSSGGNRHTLKYVDGARPLELAARDGVDFATSAIQTPSLAAYAGDFLVGVVVTPDTLAAGYARILERGASGSGVFLGSNVTNTVLAFVAGTASSSVACAAGSRHAIIVERSGTTARLYVDSATAGATWTVSGSAIADGATWLGAADGGAASYYDGKLHEVVIAKDHGAGDVAALMTYLLGI